MVWRFVCSFNRYRFGAYFTERPAFLSLRNNEKFRKRSDRACLQRGVHENAYNVYSIFPAWSYGDRRCGIAGAWAFNYRFGYRSYMLLSFQMRLASHRIRRKTDAFRDIYIISDIVATDRSYPLFFRPLGDKRKTAKPLTFR